MVRRAFLGIACAVLAVTAASPTHAADAPYEIEAMLGMTGGSAFVGESQHAALAALETTVNESGGINGRPIHFVFSDNAGSPQTAVQLAGALIDKRVPAMLVSGLTASCQAIVPLVAQGPLEYCLSPGIYPAAGGFVFSSGSSTVDAATVLVRYLRLRGLKRVAIITTTDVTGQDADRNFAGAIGSPESRAAGLAIVDAEHFTPRDLTVDAQIARIAAAKPQVIIAWEVGTPYGTVLRAIKDAGLSSVPVVGSNGNMTFAEMAQFASILPDDAYYPGAGYLAHEGATPEVRAVQQTFYAAAQRTGFSPDTPSGLAWDPAMMLIDVLKKIGTNATADQLRQAILHLRNYAGISGTYDFSDGKQRGLGEKDVLVMRWDRTQTKWVAVSRFGGEPLR